VHIARFLQFFGFVLALAFTAAATHKFTYRSSE